jgi:hypothetical protein
MSFLFKGELNFIEQATIPGERCTTKDLWTSQEAAPPMPQTWLGIMSSTQRVLGNQKRRTETHQKTVEEDQQRHYEEQRAIWAREGIFWCKLTETWESRRDGQPSKAVSGHWFHNKGKGILEMYGDLRQPPVHTKEVIFFKKHAK